MRKAVLLLASMTVAVLWASGVVVALLLLAGAGPRAAAQQQAPQPQARAKPNIVFVLTDDQFPGSEQMMPSLTDDVTREGAKFANMTSTFPLCCPGRATIQRGQYAHNTRITGNSLPRGGGRSSASWACTRAPWRRGWTPRATRPAFSAST